MKKLLALILALVMCFSLVACGGDKDDAKTENTQPTESQKPDSSEPPKQSQVTQADETVKYKDTVKISINNERQVTGFYGSTNQACSIFGVMTMEGLFAFDFTTNEIKAVIAKEATDVNGDGKTWKVTLNEGVTFHHQGEHYAELKASDVAFTYDFIKKGGAGQESGAVTRSYTITNYVDSIEVNGDYELTFNLNTPLFDFPYWATPLILSEKAIEEFGPADGQEVFTGPYYINTEKTTMGQQWTFTRFDDYWRGIENYATKNIVFVIHTDVNTGAAALQAGEVDALASDNATIALQFQSNPAYQVISQPSITTYYVACNSYDGTGFFDGEDTEEKVKLRQAINMALDRDEIVSILFSTNPDAGSRVDNFLGSWTAGYVDQGGWEFNIEKAQGMMEELGYSESNRLPLVLVHTAANATYAQIIQDQLKEIYIDIETKAIDGSQYGSFLRTGKDWDLFINYFTPKVTMAETVTGHVESTGSGSKTQGWASAIADEKIAEVMGQPSLEKQLEAFGEFQGWLHNYFPKFPTHRISRMIEAKAEVEGVAVSPDPAFQDYTTIRIPE